MDAKRPASTTLCLDDCVAGGFRVPGQTDFTFEQARGKKHSFARCSAAMLSCAVAMCSRGLSVVKFAILRNRRNNASEKKNKWLEDLRCAGFSLEGTTLIRFERLLVSKSTVSRPHSENYYGTRVVIPGWAGESNLRKIKFEVAHSQSLRWRL